MDFNIQFLYNPSMAIKENELPQALPNSEVSKQESLLELSADSSVLSRYLTSSYEFYDINNIPIKDTLWNPETGEFILEFITPETSQAYEGICHGGFTAMLIDSILRLPILGNKYNRDDFTDMVSIKYMRKVEVGATIRVTGKIDPNNEGQVKISAYIVDTSRPTKVLAKGSLSIDKKTDTYTSGESEDMYEGEDGVTLGELSKEHDMLREYLLSSADFYNINNIPINDAIWNEESGELAIDIETSSINQAEDGLCQIGYILTLLDSIAGFPVFLKSIKEEKIALSDELTIKSFGDIKVGSKIRVVGKIQSIDGKKSKSKASVLDMSDSKGRVLAEGSLTMNIL
jgi:acyl-coenzyme A thioesterase PaaI-like protein